MSRAKSHPNLTKTFSNAGRLDFTDIPWPLATPAGAADEARAAHGAPLDAAEALRPRRGLAPVRLAS
eukprot:scaffold66685_cov61-Phaeocystis_antarctica.AAC.1